MQCRLALNSPGQVGLDTFPGILEVESLLWMLLEWWHRIMTSVMVKCDGLDVCYVFAVTVAGVWDLWGSLDRARQVFEYGTVCY